MECGGGSVLSRGRFVSLTNRPRLRTLPPPHSYGNQRLQRQFDGLLMMGIIMPETCWAVSVRQSNKFYDWLLHLVGCFEWPFIYFVPLAWMWALDVETRCHIKDITYISYVDSILFLLQNLTQRDDKHKHIADSLPYPFQLKFHCQGKDNSECLLWYMGTEFLSTHTLLYSLTSHGLA